MRKLATAKQSFTALLNTNYQINDNLQICNKTGNPIKRDLKERFRLKHNNIRYTIYQNDIPLLLSGKYSTIEDFNKQSILSKTYYYQTHLPKDLYQKMVQSKLDTDSNLILIEHLLISDKENIKYLPINYTKSLPVEVSAKYIEKIGLKESDIDSLKKANIIQQIPYEIPYKETSTRTFNKSVDFSINNHFCKRYEVIWSSHQTVSVTIKNTSTKKYDLNIYDLFKYTNYINNFKITDFTGFIEYYDLQKEITNTEYYKTKDIKKKKKLDKQKMYLDNQIELLRTYNIPKTFYRNYTNSREEKYLNRIPSECHKYTSLNDMVQIDINNSQMRMLLILLTNSDSIYYKRLNNEYKKLINDYKESSEAELLKLIEVVNYGMKQWFSEKYYYDGEFTKHQIMLLLGDYDYSKYKEQIFKNEFPNLIILLKLLNSTNGYNKFIIELQKIESDFVLDRVSCLMIRKGIMNITKHDAWFISKENLNEAKNIIDMFFNKESKKIKNNYKIV